MNSEIDRVAVVTGASGGIGRAIAAKLAGEGMDVLVHYATNADVGEEVAETVRAAGRRGLVVQGDVADEHDMIRLFDTAERELGGIDVVVHSAGIMPLAPVAELDLDVLDNVLRTNLRSTFVVNQLAAARVRPGGAIINLSTSVTRVRPPRYGAYAASKAGVEALTLILARELRGRDVTVNAVAPGPVGTPLFLDGKTDEEVERVASSNPFGRLAEPEEIAEVTAFLAGPGHWVNGQVIFANGGMA